jgi:hypothetical protein
MKHRLLKLAERAPVVRQLVRRAVDALSPDVDPSGVLVLRLVPEAEPNNSELRRMLVALESAGVQSPPWLPLARLGQLPWPAESPTVLVTLDRPTRSFVDRVIEVTSELQWAPIVFATPGSPLLQHAPDLTGQGVVLAPLLTGKGPAVTETSVRATRDTFAQAIGYAPNFVAFPENADPEWAGRAARQAGFGAAFGTQVGLASSRSQLTLQPRVTWSREMPVSELQGWALRDRDALATAELTRWISRVNAPKSSGG